jgi:aminoglycoside 6'-N-acetyltransferase
MADQHDLHALFSVLTSPGVPQWWHVTTHAQCQELLDEESTTLLIELDGEVVGVIEFSEEDDPEYRHASIDLAIHGGWHRRGLASEALRLVVDHLLVDRGHHRITIDPAAHNAAAIACYAKIGFRPVGVMRQYERGLDGTFHDGLLMDLLAADLR